MDASVIVCTYNRCDSLSDTLAALQAQQLDDGRSWEVIVVDNNSQDQTRAVVEALARSWPVLRYEFEAEQGHSHARNHGIGVARGETLLFTDDDVMPEPDWLEKILSGLEQYRAEACGGYIAPVWEVPPPQWLTERFYGFLAVRTDSSDYYRMDPSDPPPFGANMAFRKTVFEQVGLFDTNRGRKGNILASGDDGDMFERIFAAGLSVVFLGGARVHHKVEAFRCTKAYLRRWRRQTSRNIAMSKGVLGDRRLLNIPLFLFPQLARAILRTINGHLTQSADEAVHREMIVSHFIGTMQGLFRMRNANASKNGT